MKREIVAGAIVPPPAERRLAIEAEPLAANLAALVREAAADGGETLVWNFFESGERMTYGELWPRVEALAAGLARIGVGRADHVAVMLPNVAAFPLSWLAIATLDAVMTHFPELRVIASPPGWPWVSELIAVAWRHRNVHIGLVAVRPKVLAIPGSGYEPLLQYGDTLLQDRIIFGSAWPMQPVAEAVAEIEALPLKDDVRRQWLGENAARVLRLS